MTLRTNEVYQTNAALTQIFNDEYVFHDRWDTNGELRATLRLYMEIRAKVGITVIDSL
jgi:hypothetical protein